MSILREFVHLVMNEKIRDKQGIEKRSFELNKFKKLDSTISMIEYAENSLSLLGSGSARNVYALTGHRVLKIATNNKGLAQNKAEFSVFNNPASKDLVTKIFDHDPNFSWLISEIVRQASETEIQRAMNLNVMPFDEFVYAACRKQFDMIEHYGEIDAVDFARELQRFVDTNDLLAGDLAKESSWGLSPDGRLVILDSGFTYDVADMY